MAQAWAPYIKNFINHPKFLVLSSGAVCLWLEGKNYADTHLTDGMIPRDALRMFRFNTRARVEELLQVVDGYTGPLWESHVAGFKMHDYLDHNACRDEVLAGMERNDASKAKTAARQKAFRDRKKAEAEALRHADSNALRERDANVAVTPLNNNTNNNTKTKAPSEQKSAPPADGRSKRPIFTGQRLTVFEWMLDDCLRTLGADADAFDLHAWFFDLDARAVRDGLVIPKRDSGAWLQAQLVAEAQRRGVRLVFATMPSASSTRAPVWQPWECPHEPKCTEGRWRCDQRTALDAARKASA